MSKPTSKVDVLIVGAGPAGLMLALWMSRLGGGLVPASHIPKAAQRIRVSYALPLPDSNA